MKPHTCSAQQPAAQSTEDACVTGEAVLNNGGGKHFRPFLLEGTWVFYGVALKIHNFKSEDDTFMTWHDLGGQPTIPQTPEGSNLLPDTGNLRGMPHTCRPLPQQPGNIRKGAPSWGQGPTEVKPTQVPGHLVT